MTQQMTPSLSRAARTFSSSLTTTPARSSGSSGIPPNTGIRSLHCAPRPLRWHPAGLYPIGQHGISLTSDGLLMLFDDGDPSANQPAGAPAGQALTYSPVVAYSIDAASMTAQEAWSFDYGETLLSPVCSSAYEAPGQSILVDYAVTDGWPPRSQPPAVGWVAWSAPPAGPRRSSVPA
jgi:hypothetical protein